MAKAFISFLGTNDYLDCRYSLNKQPGNIVKYFQEDLADRFCRPWEPEDHIRIFTTAEALQKNWQDNGHKDRDTNKFFPNKGLERCLKNMGLAASVRRYDIPEGKDEDEIWTIFEQIFETLDIGDEIIFDITHGFRSIPMLFMSLIGYARLLKKITVLGIYYGAFESLGQAREVKKIKPAGRIAPIFDLTSFEQLIQWTEATQSFVMNGSASEFKQLADQGVNPVLRDSRGKDRVAASIRDVAKGMDHITRNLLLNRGAEIIEYDYDLIREKLSFLEKENIFIRPLPPLMKEIQQKINVFTKNNIQNGFAAVDWCLHHGLYQQAITMLQETIVTFILSAEGLDWGIEINRTAAVKALKLASHKDIAYEGDPAAEPLVRQLTSNAFVQVVASDLESLSKIRNDVNHGGYLTELNRKAKNTHSILNRFENIRESIQQKMSGLETGKKDIPIINKSMFLLFSHQLTLDQQESARIDFGVTSFHQPPETVQAIWSQIPSDTNHLTPILQPVERWLEQKAQKGDLVLIQGDFGATFLMVSHALSLELIPVYATTQRQAKDKILSDGRMETHHIFKFKQFRVYGQ
jgi:CRISPR-associated Csx2 family protein